MDAITRAAINATIAGLEPLARPAQAPLGYGRDLACLDDLEELPAELLTWAPRHAPDHVAGNLREALTLLEVDRDVRAELADDPLGGLSPREIRLENLRGQAPPRGNRPGAAP